MTEVVYTILGRWLMEEWLTVAQAARELGCVMITIRRYIHTGVLPEFRAPGGQFRIRREDLEQVRAQPRPAAGVREVSQ